MGWCSRPCEFWKHCSSADLSCCSLFRTKTQVLPSFLVLILWLVIINIWYMWELFRSAEWMRVCTHEGMIHSLYSEILYKWYLIILLAVQRVAKQTFASGIQWIQDLAKADYSSECRPCWWPLLHLENANKGRRMHTAIPELHEATLVSTHLSQYIAICF